MSLPVPPPFHRGFPEVMEEFLEHGITKCIAFNRRGTLLAAGCQDGGCVIWDFETRGVAKELRDKDSRAPITSVCWSKDGHLLLASATDKSLTLWNVAQAKSMAHLTLAHVALQARLRPGLGSPVLCLACPVFTAPILVDFISGSMYALPTSTDTGYRARHRLPPRNVASSPVAACFNKRGDLIFIGNSIGEILVVNTEARRVQALFQLPGGAILRHIVFSRSGRYLLTNSGDRILRVLEVRLPQDRAAAALGELVNAAGENTRLVGSQCLAFCGEFQDAATHSPWRAICFSGDGLWVVAASASKSEHKLYIWDRCGQLVKILEGPKERVTDVAWHPVAPVVASVGFSGVVYLWAKDYTQTWSAFAPDFKEIEENEEYVEREGEFDNTGGTEKVKPTHADEDEEVDIMTAEKFPGFSDSDDSQEGLHYLPAVPLPDSPKQEDRPRGSPSKPESSSPRLADGPPVAEEGKAGTSEPSVCQISNSPAGRIKKRVKVCKKGGEMQAHRSGPNTNPNTRPKPDRFASNEGGFPDSTLSVESTSKKDAQGSLWDEILLPGGKMRIRRPKLIASITCSSDSSSLPASESDGFDNER